MNEKTTKTSDREFYLFALKIASDFGATIAAPVVVFVLVGRWLDKFYSREMVFTTLAFILSALISGSIIYRKAKRYGNEYQALVNKK